MPKKATKVNESEEKSLKICEKNREGRKDHNCAQRINWMLNFAKSATTLECESRKVQKDSQAFFAKAESETVSDGKRLPGCIFTTTAAAAGFPALHSFSFF